MNKEISIKKIIGFENLEKQFQNIISLRNNQTWMLIGRKGIGKRTLSMRFAGFVINNFNKKWEETSLTNKIFKKETDNLFYITSFDEKSSGKISKEQRAGEWEVWETDLQNPSFAAYARLCGGHGVRVTELSELDAAMAEALAHDGPSLIEIMTDAELV